MAADGFAGWPGRSPRGRPARLCRVALAPVFSARRIAGPSGYLRRRLARTADWALIDRVAAATAVATRPRSRMRPIPLPALPGSAAVSPIVRLLPIVAPRQRSTTEWMNALSTPWLESTLSSRLAARDHVLGQLAEAQARRQGRRPRRRRTRACRARAGMPEACGRVRNGRADDVLVALVRHAHDEQGIALRDDGRVELRRALRHHAEEDAVLAAFLGDARNRLAGRAEANAFVAGRIAVGLLAHEQQRHRAIAPQARSRTPCGRAPDATGSTTSDGKPASCITVIGLPFAGKRNNWPTTSAIVSPRRWHCRT